MNEVAVAYGIDMNFHYKWPWNEETRDADCIKDAITKATCGASTSWTRWMLQVGGLLLGRAKFCIQLRLLSVYLFLSWMLGS